MIPPYIHSHSSDVTAWGHNLKKHLDMSLIINSIFRMLPPHGSLHSRSANYVFFSWGRGWFKIIFQSYIHQSIFGLLSSIIPMNIPYHSYLIIYINISLIAIIIRVIWYNMVGICWYSIYFHRMVPWSQRIRLPSTPPMHRWRVEETPPNSCDRAPGHWELHSSGIYRWPSRMLWLYKWRCSIAM